MALTTETYRRPVVNNYSVLHELFDAPDIFANVTSNSSLDSGYANKTFSRDENLAKVEIAVQAVIFTLAVFGNSVVLFALGCKRKKRSRMTMLITNLSIADLYVAFFNILPQLIWDITWEFKGGDVLCRFVKYAQVVAMYASSYVLVMTAIDRYIALCHPLVSQTWTSRKVHIMVAIAWTLSLIFAVPQLIIFSYKLTEYGSYDCWATFSLRWSLKAYVTWFFFAIFLIPFVILVFCYGNICVVVWRSINGKAVNSTKNSQRENGTLLHSSRTLGAKVPRAHARGGVSKAKMKTVKLTLTVVLCYIACWSPFFISQMWAAWDANAPFSGAPMTIILLLAGMNSCTNPWIYMVFTDNLCHKLRSAFCGVSHAQGRHSRAVHQFQGQSLRTSTALFSFRE